MLARLPVIAVCVLVVIGATGCAETGNESETTVSETLPAYPLPGEFPDVDVIEDLAYGSPDPSMTVDVCRPKDDAETTAAAGTSGEAAAVPADTDAASPRAAIVSVHGGSWRGGDKAIPGWRTICQWLASEGFVAVSANYRLAPANPYPAGIEDVRQVVRWLRDEGQVERFDLDPDRIGAFGGSAGGNLVAQLGLEGDGELISGTRVAAVVDLSGPIDLTTAGFDLGGVSPTFQRTQLDYLGCADYADCPRAREASPLYDVDPTDPPFFVGHSRKEFIPIEQSDALVTALRDDGIDTTYVTPDGTLHAAAMLDDDLRQRIGRWFRTVLAP